MIGSRWVSFRSHIELICKMSVLAVDVHLQAFTQVTPMIRPTPQAKQRFTPTQIVCVCVCVSQIEHYKPPSLLSTASYHLKHRMHRSFRNRSAPKSSSEFMTLFPLHTYFFQSVKFCFFSLSVCAFKQQQKEKMKRCKKDSKDWEVGHLQWPHVKAQ